MVIIMILTDFIVWVRCRAGSFSREGPHCPGLHRFLDDFVEFSSIQPDATASGAIIDFDPLALGHDQVGFFTDWAFHDSFLSPDLRSFTHNIRRSREQGVSMRGIAFLYETSYDLFSRHLWIHGNRAVTGAVPSRK
jgi:hypothetical protein